MTALHTDAEHVAAKMYGDFRTYVSRLEADHVISAGQRAELCKGFLKTISDTFNVNPLEIAKGTSDQLAVQKIIRLIESDTFSTPKEVFAREYGDSKNFMTPQAEGYYYITRPEDAQRVVEISSGTGLKNDPIFGVTVVDMEADGSTKRRDDLSKVFSSRTDATEYMQELESLS